ncbi:MAG TPA: hypothetical protein VL326_04090 [Kofleriaceae bacterium]|nr:hypothetical protein [Kofleriaceae bacterium]
MSVLVVINCLLAILGGILATSNIIVAKRPDAKQLIDRLTPYQVFIGVGLVIVGLIDFVKSLKGLTDFFKVNLFSAASLLTMIACSVLLGLLFGAPSFMKMLSGGPPPPPTNPYAQQYQQMMMQQQGYVPPSTAQNRLQELTQKIAPFQVMIGLLALLAALVTLLYQFKIIKYSGGGPI